jgi:hypothetical protein
MDVEPFTDRPSSPKELSLYLASGHRREGCEWPLVDDGTGPLPLPPLAGAGPAGLV